MCQCLGYQIKRLVIVIAMSIALPSFAQISTLHQATVPIYDTPQSIDPNTIQTLALPATDTNTDTAFLHSNFSQAKLHSLSQELGWRRLLLYKDGATHSSLNPLGDNRQFFVSAKHDDAYAELIANIEALSGTSRTEYLCRFPARAYWLFERLPELKTLGDTTCADFERWASQIDAKKLTLVHAEEHIRRIGSMFAHTLVKIDNTNSLHSQNSDDAYYFNFATDESAAGNLGNTIKGTSPAAMTIERFTDKQASYLLTDERDLWEFELDLSQDEIDQIIRHLWEVKNLHRYYNFLHNNCASEIVRMLDVVDAKRTLLAQAGKVIAPIEVSKVLQKNHLLKSTKVTPSYRTLLSDDTTLSIKDYHQHMRTSRLPSIDKSSQNPTTASPVHRLSLGVAHTQADRVYTLDFRGAYQDFLDRSAGKRPFIYTNIASATLAYEDSLKLKNATLIDFLSLSPINAPLPKASYGGHLMLSREYDAGSDDHSHLVASLGGEYGSSWQLGDKALCFALGTAQTQLGRLTKGYRLGVGAHVGCSHLLNERTRLLFESKVPVWYHNTDRNVYIQPRAVLSMQYDIRPNLALRLSADYEKLNHQDRHALEAKLLWYFD